MADFRTYRDKSTGVVREYPAALADSFPNLIEVEPDTKPLAYVPIPKSAIEEHKASKVDADETANLKEAKP